MTTIAPVDPHGNAKAVYVEDFEDAEARVEAGHWHFYTSHGDPEQKPAGILFGCPCGCGQLKAVGFTTRETSSPKWQWNGERDGITLTPSIHILQMDAAGQVIGSHWHGFLTNGEFLSC